MSKDSTPEIWTHDPRGFRHKDFLRLLSPNSTRSDKANLTRIRGVMVQLAIKEGGFTRDPDGSLVSREVVELAVERSSAGGKVEGVQEKSLALLMTLLASSVPLELVDDTPGASVPAEANHLDEA